MSTIRNLLVSIARWSMMTRAPLTALDLKGVMGIFIAIHVKRQEMGLDQNKSGRGARSKKSKRSTAATRRYRCRLVRVAECLSSVHY